MIERQWSYAEVEWGTTLCAARCGRPAELLYAGEPFCCADVERLLERQVLLAAYPDYGQALPPVFRADED